MNHIKFITDFNKLDTKTAISEGRTIMSYLIGFLNREKVLTDLLNIVLTNTEKADLAFKLQEQIIESVRTKDFDTAIPEIQEALRFEIPADWQEQQKKDFDELSSSNPF